MELVSSVALSTLALLPNPKLQTLDLGRDTDLGTALPISRDAFEVLPMLTGLRELHMSCLTLQGQLSSLSTLRALTNLRLLGALRSHGLAAGLHYLTSLKTLGLELLVTSTGQGDAAQAAAANTFAVALSGAIGRLSRLEHLEISGGEPGMLGGLSNLQGLTYLAWSSHRPYPLPQQVSNLLHLQSLSYIEGTGNEATNWREAATLLLPLTKLQQLEVSLRGPGAFPAALTDALKQLPQLSAIGLQGPGGWVYNVGGLPGFSGLAALTCLTSLKVQGLALSRAPLLSVLSVFTSLRELRDLRLRMCDLTDTHMAAVTACLSQLTTLDLVGVTGVTSQMLSTVSQLQKLQKLDLSGTKGMDAACQRELPEHLRQYPVGLGAPHGFGAAVHAAAVHGVQGPMHMHMFGDDMHFEALDLQEAEHELLLMEEEDVEEM